MADERLVVVVKGGPSTVAFGRKEAIAKAAKMRKEFPGHKVEIKSDNPGKVNRGI